jgi:GNAT superfamily N-acetyltransferase/2'-5' RNA ligase
MNTQAKTPNGSDRLTVDGWTASAPRRWKHEWISESPHLAGSLDVALSSSSNSSPAHALAAHDGPFAEDQGFHVASHIVSHDGWTVKSDVPSEPPNYRPAAKRLNAPHCGSCKMYEHGKCWGYGNKPVEEDYVCDSYSPSSHTSAVDDWHSPAEGSTYDEGHPLAELAARHPNVDLFATEKPQGLRLKMIQVAPEHQREGYAGAALRDLLSYADERGKPVALNPGDVEGRPGMSNPQLRRWYQQHGFVPNTGRNKDYTFTEAMIRPPQASTDNSLQQQADNPTDGMNEVDSTTSSFAGDLDWKSPVFDNQGSESGWRLAASPDELFIALNVPKPTADEIHAWAKEQDWPEGTELEEPSEYHITLLYSPKGHKEHKEAEWWATDNSDNVEVKALDEFPSQERGEQSAFVLRVDRPDDEIKIRMNKLLDKAEEEGVEVNRYPGGSKPHITIAYGPKLPKGIKPPEITFNTDEAHCGTPRTSSLEDMGVIDDFAEHAQHGSSTQSSPYEWDSEARTNMPVVVGLDGRDKRGRNAKQEQPITDAEHDHDFRLADYNVQVPVVTPNQGVGLATPHQVGDLLSIQSVGHNLHYKYQQSGLDPTSAQQYASKLLQAIGYTNPDQPTIDAALQAWKTMYPEDARSTYALPGTATSSHDADGGFGDAALDWTDSHAASASDSEIEGLALLEFGGLSGRDSNAASDAEDDGSLGWHEPRVAQTMYHWAPRQHREQIAQEGLRAALPEGDEYVDYSNPEAYKGVYMFNQPPRYTPGGSKGFYGDDLWAVDTSGLTVQPDPGEFDASMVPHDIDPGRIQYLNSPAHRKAWEQFDEERYGRRMAEYDYRSPHTAPGPEDSPLTDMESNGAADLYTHPQYYGTGEEEHDRESMAAIHQARGNPDALVTIHRAAPVSDINPGDWVSLSHSYAKQEGRHPTDPKQDMRVWSARVPASTIYWDGNSINEMGYHGPAVQGQKFYRTNSNPELRPASEINAEASAGGAAQNMPSEYDWTPQPAISAQIARSGAQTLAQGVDTLSNPSRQPVTQARTHEESASTSAERSQGGSPSDELSHFLRVADSWDTRQWPDPLSDNGTGGNVPRGCTCQKGHKLDCPIHGLEANGEYDTMEWTIPEASPVGYPQDQPRNWQQASSVSTSPTVRDDVDHDDEAKRNSKTDQGRATERTNNSTKGNEYEWHQVHAPSIAERDSQGVHSTALAHHGTDVKCRPSYKALLVPSGLRQSIEIVGSDEHLEWYSSSDQRDDVSPHKTSGPISDGTGTPDVTVEEVDAPSPLATNDPWNENFRDRRPLLYHVPTGRVLMGPPGSEHGSLYNHLGRTTPEWLPEEVHEGIIGKGGVKFFDDNSSNPEGYPQEAADAVVHHTGIAEDPEVDKDYGWDFNGSLSKEAAVPVQYHGDIKPSEGYPGWEDGDMFGEPIGYEGRWPTVVHNGTVHIGPEQSTHGQVRQKLGLPASGPEPEGWIGRNPEYEEDNNDHEDVEFVSPHDEEGVPYGWYGHKGVPHQNTGITESMMNYWNTFLRNKPPTPGTGYGHGPRMSSHNLTWEPGNRGKGLLFLGDTPEENEVHTWNTDNMQGTDPEPWHSQYMKEQFGRSNMIPDERFEIMNDGRLDAIKKPENGQLIAQTDPRLHMPDHEWTFSKSAGVSVHEVGEPTDSGTEWHGTRRPFIYFPHEQDLILGAQGADHAAMLASDPRLFQKYRRKQLDDDTAHGGVYNDAQGNKVVEYYYGTPEDEHVQAVQNALGASRSQLNEWHVGDDVHDNPDKTWDFNSKVASAYDEELEGKAHNPENFRGEPGDQYDDSDGGWGKGFNDAYGREHEWHIGEDWGPEHADMEGGKSGIYDPHRYWIIEPDGTRRTTFDPEEGEEGNDWDFNSALRGAQEGPTGDELRQIEDSQPQERQGLIPLSWEPGLHGKGLYFPSSDKLTTWSDPRHHSDVWYDDEHYPEPGVAHHLDIQPNGQYVDQGAFNRDMENNNEGLDEGELAQAIQRHEPRLTDRDPGHEWSFSKVAHQLGWQPGEHGKGLVHNGEIHTWGVGDAADGWPSHPEYADKNLGMHTEPEFVESPTWDTAFQMDPDGRVNVYEPQKAQQLGQQIESADPRLKLNYNSDYDWDFGSTEPQKTEPDMDEHGNLHGVQFTNDSPGVATVDA